MKRILIGLFAVGLLALAGCGSSEPAPPTNTPVPEVEIGDAERGRMIFENGGANDNYTQEAVCSRCHTLDGSDERAHQAPDLMGISERAGDRVPELSAAQYIYQSITDTRAYVVDDYAYMKMGIRRLLLEDEIPDLVAFLLTQ